MSKGAAPAAGPEVPVQAKTLPNLVIIGAAKCGTTSLHHYLDLHPDISMSSHKEPQLFSFADWRDRLKDYAQWLDPAAAVRGESSTNYTKMPRWQGVAERMHSVMPDARLIYIVGDPIARTIAHYVESYALRLENRTFQTALLDYDQPGNEYVATSMYATQLEPYAGLFPRDRILVLDQEDLRRKRAETLKEVFRFVEVDEDAPLAGIDQELNAGVGKERMAPSAERLWAAVGAPVVKRLPVRWREPIRDEVVGRLSQRLTKPAMPPKVERELREMFRPEIDRLRSLTGKPFDQWSF